MSTPEAIRLAAKQYRFEFDEPCATGDELRRLSALNAELVGALSDVLGRLVDKHETDEAAVKARALIAKAEGGAA